MFGNLFTAKKYGEEDGAGDQQLQSPMSPNSAVPQSVVESPTQTAGMDPMKRQNVESLTHLDARANQVLQQAQNEAKKAKLAQIEPDIVMLGLLFDKEVYKTLQEFSVNVGDLAREIQQKQVIGTFEGAPILSPASQKIFDEAFTTAKIEDQALLLPKIFCFLFLIKKQQLHFWLQKAYKKRVLRRTSQRPLHIRQLVKNQFLSSLELI